MTEEVSLAPSTLECNGETPPENVPTQVVDVIAGLSKPAGEVPVEEVTCALPEETQETKTGPEKTSENANDCEVATKEETQLEKQMKETDNTINDLKEMELQEPGTDNDIHPAKTDEEREVDEVSENTPTIGSDNGNEAESCFYDQESDAEETPPNSPTSGSLSGSPKGQPGLELKLEISKHNYSKYDTVSYRKIRKGNTKQRIDEFESMMTL
ncbi:ermin [Lissotriton helveticus]